MKQNSIGDKMTSRIQILELKQHQNTIHKFCFFQACIIPPLKSSDLWNQKVGSTKNSQFPEISLKLEEIKSYILLGYPKW
jgi:hypothetical protein